MSTIVQCTILNEIIQEIQSHSAWVGFITGLEAESLLKGREKFVYLLRAGETTHHFYISYVDHHGALRHQPFRIVFSPDGWVCENGCGRGPYMQMKFGHIIDDLMHCSSGISTPLSQWTLV